MIFSEDPLKDFYEAIAKEDSWGLARVHIPRSEVFYVRAAIEAKTGEKISLKHVERVLYEEGYLSKSDCHPSSIGE